MPGHQEGSCTELEKQIKMNRMLGTDQGALIHRETKLGWALGGYLQRNCAIC